jgi:uncharacterized membrane protein
MSTDRLLRSLPIHRVFAILAFIFGLIVMWATPPFQSPDESNHYHRIAHISDGSLMCTQLAGNRLGGEIDYGLFEFSTRFDSIRKSDNPRFTSQDFQWAKSQKSGNPSFVDIANVGYYSPSVYLPHSIVLTLFSPINLSPYSQLFLLRLINLLTWVLLITLSIKIIPIGKLLIAFIGLLPSHIALASAVSGDTLSHGLCLLWMALLLRAMLTSHQVKWKEWIIWMLIIFLITINKVVYFPLALLILAVPKTQWKHHFRMLFPLLVIVLLTLVLWIPYSSSLFIPYDLYDIAHRDSQQLNPGVNPSEQLTYVLSNPLAFFKTAVVSYVESAPATWAHYIGKFGWEKNYLHPLIILFLTLGLFANALFTSVKESFLNRRQRLVILLSAFLMLAGFSLSIYMQWSPVGNNRILSLSGRYLIPIIPLFLVMFPRKWIGRYSHLLDLGTLAINVIGLIGLVLAMIARWY